MNGSRWSRAVRHLSRGALSCREHRSASWLPVRLLPLRMLGKQGSFLSFADTGSPNPGVQVFVEQVMAGHLVPLATLLMIDFPVPKKGNFSAGLSPGMRAAKNSGTNQGFWDVKLRRLCGRRPSLVCWPRTRGAASLLTKMHFRAHTRRMVGNVAEQHNAPLEAFSQTPEFARVNSQLERGPTPLYAAGCGAWLAS
jgi:hypothetical protein